MLRGETHAFVDAFDSSYEISHDLATMMQTDIPLNVVTKYESLVKIMTQSSLTIEKRLMIDLQAYREAYNERSIDNVGWDRPAHNMAYGQQDWQGGLNTTNNAHRCTLDGRRRVDYTPNRYRRDQQLTCHDGHSFYLSLFIVALSILYVFCFRFSCSSLCCLPPFSFPSPL